MESFNRKGAQTFPLVAKQRGGTQGGEFMSFTEGTEKTKDNCGQGETKDLSIQTFRNSSIYRLI